MNWEIGEEILITHPLLAKNSKEGEGRPAVIIDIEKIKLPIIFGDNPDGDYSDIRLTTKGIGSPTAAQNVFNEVWCKKKFEDDKELDYRVAVNRWALRFEGLKK